MNHCRRHLGKSVPGNPQYNSVEKLKRVQHVQRVSKSVATYPLTDGDKWRSHWRGQGGAECPLDSEKFAKNREIEGENQEKRGKEGENQEKEENREDSSTLPLLTDRAGYGMRDGEGKSNFFLSLSFLQIPGCLSIHIHC